MVVISPVGGISSKKSGRNFRGDSEVMHGRCAKELSKDIRRSLFSKVIAEGFSKEFYKALLLPGKFERIKD